MTTYAEILRPLGIQILAEACFGEYQGDYLLGVRGPDGRVGVVVVGYGSCEGCDAPLGAADEGPAALKYPITARRH